MKGGQFGSQTKRVRWAYRPIYICMRLIGTIVNQGQGGRA